MAKRVRYMPYNPNKPKMLRFVRASTRAECAGRRYITKGLPVPMTPRQRDVYLYVRYFWEKYGYAPSYADITHGLGLKDRSGMVRIVKRLVDLGVLDHERHGKRTLKPASVQVLRLIEHKHLIRNSDVG